MKTRRGHFGLRSSSISPRCKTEREYSEEVKRLKREVKVKTDRLECIEERINIRSGIKDESVLEYTLKEKRKAEEESKRLMEENSLLGRAMDHIKASLVPNALSQKPALPYTIQEIEAALLDIHDEYEVFKRENKLERGEMEDKQAQNIEYEQHITALKTEILDLRKENLQYMEYMEYNKSTIPQLQSEVDKYTKMNKKDLEEKKILDSRVEFFKRKYLEESKRGFKHEERISTLIEENKCHLEYISILESRANELEREMNKVSENSHNRLTIMREKSINEILFHADQKSPNTKHEIELRVREQEIMQIKELNEDLYSQLKILVEGKEMAQTNLSLCRHNLLQAAMGMDDMQRKICAIEHIRLTDLTYINRLESILKYNHIQF